MGEDANHAFPHLIPSAAYNPWPGHEVPTELGRHAPTLASVAYNPWLGHGEPSELERHAPTLAPPGLLFEEESALVRHYMIHRRFRFVHAVITYLGLGTD